MDIPRKCLSSWTTFIHAVQFIFIAQSRMVFQTMPSMKRVLNLYFCFIGTKSGCGRLSFHLFRVLGADARIPLLRKVYSSWEVPKAKRITLVYSPNDVISSTQFNFVKNVLQKGACHENFEFRFFREADYPGPLSIRFEFLQKFAEIFETFLSPVRQLSL